MTNLAPEDVDAIAHRVVELLAEGQQPNPALVDAITLARILGVSSAYVYEHADELGAIRLGTGPKPRLRFDVTQATSTHQKTTPVIAPRDMAPRRHRRRSTPQPTVLKSRPQGLPANGQEAG
jgi:hypothetical protein